MFIQFGRVAELVWFSSLSAGFIVVASSSLIGAGNEHPPGAFALAATVRADQSHCGAVNGLSSDSDDYQVRWAFD